MYSVILIFFDFEIILIGLGTPFLALWASFFESFFYKRSWATDTTGGGPLPRTSETAVHLHSWTQIGRLKPF